MDHEKNSASSETLLSQDSNKRFGRIIGFDLGSSALSCSLSTDKTPKTATAFTNWANGSTIEPLFPACIQYKNWSSTNCSAAKVGFEGRPDENPLNEGDFYVPSVKSHVIQWITEGSQDNQPDASQVLNDFFQAVRTHLENAFNKFNDKLDRAQEQKARKPKSATADAAAATATAAKRYSLDDCQFCFSVPDSLTCKTEYTDLIRKAFVEAGFLKQKDIANRLIFVTDAVAAGYSCVHAPQSFSGIQPDTSYLVVDLGYDSAEFAVIQAQKTAATSIVLPRLHESKVAGYRSFSDNFRKFVTQRSATFGVDSTQPEEVDMLVDAFEEYRTNKTDLSADTGTTEFTVNEKHVIINNRDLREHVFNPYLDDIFSLVFKHCQADRVASVIFRGHFCQDPYFLTKSISFIADKKASFLNIPTVVNWEKQPEYMVSNGAVSYGLRSALVQIPLFVPSKKPANQADESSKVPEKKATKKSSEKPQYLGLPKGHYAVGIDFGTTFSGCSYANISNLKPGEEPTIETITNWDTAYEYPKIPTALRYNTRSGKFTKLWGYEALKSKKSLKDGEVKLEFFKLLLSPENVERFYGHGNRQIQEVQEQYFMTGPKENAKTLTPVDIIATYLKYFNRRIQEYLSKKHKIPQKKLRLTYVITVPVMWTNTGRATMIEAAIKAGLIKKDEEEYIQLITEPEAAALSYEKFMKTAWKLDSDYYEKELVFTVFDAGGGTVDLVTFQQTVKETEDGKKEKQIKQIGDGTGDTCGAVHLDKRFREVIVQFYTETMGQKFHPGDTFIDYHVEYFRDNIKEHFMPSSRPDAVYRIPLPPYPEISLDIVPKPYKESSDPEKPNPRCRLVEKNTVFEISRAEVKRCIFDPIVNKAVGVLKTHLEKTRNHPPSAVLLVGGFCRSKYLQYRIQRFCTQEGITHVSAPPEGVTAISRGAVRYFLEQHLSSYRPKLQILSYQTLVGKFGFGRQSTSGSVSTQSGTIYSRPFSSILDDRASYPTWYTDDSNVPHKTSKREESEHLVGSVDYSMYYYSIGIEIGSNSISCSYANLYDQTEVHSITEWNTNPEMEDEYSTGWMLEQESFLERYPTCILYKGMNQRDRTILCGYDALLAPKTANDLFIPNIKTLLNNTVAQTLSSEFDAYGLSAFTIVKDFLKGFLKHLRPILIDNIRENLLSQFAQDRKITSDPEDYILKKDIDERMQQLQHVLYAPNGLLDNSQFNIVWPANRDTDSSMVDNLIRVAFAESGEFGPNFNSRRLQFTSRADATAYTCLSRPKYISKLKYQQHYLVCDIGYTSVTFAKIATGGSAAASNSIYSLDTVLPGVETINDHFKNYLYKNKAYYGIASESQIKDLVVDFSEKNLKTVFDLSEEEGSFVHISVANAPHIRIPNNTLCHAVVKEFLNDVIHKLNELYKEESNVDKVFVSGRYHRTQLFWEQVTEVNKDPTFANNIVSLSGDSGHDASSGAVRHGINSEGRSMQLPEHDGFQQQTTKLAEPPLEDFNSKDDFVLGIDLGDILSGCSYKAPSEQNVQVVKNWHCKPYGNKDGKIPTALVVKDRKNRSFKILHWGDEAKSKKRKTDEQLVKGMKLNLCKEDTTQFYKNDFFKGREGYIFEDLLKEYPMLNEENVLDLLISYLETLIKHFKKSQKLKTSQKLCIVLTAPSMWSTITRHRIIEKAIEKNIVGKKDKLKIKIINELEAAAIAYDPCLSQLQNGNNPWTFILADIGGKTADVSTFQLSSKYAKNNLIRTISSFNDDRGGVCGASFLEERFGDLVAKILHDNIIAKDGLLQHLVYYSNFFIARLEENHFKHSVRDKKSRFEIPLPKFQKELCRDRGNYNHYIDPVGKKLRILYKDINDHVFDPLVEKITDLLKAQVEKSVAPVDAIVLIGGFSNSTYLQNRIKQAMPVSPKLIIKNTDVALYNRSTCVSQGAASYFMDSRLLSRINANQTYAMSVGNKDNKNALMCIVRKNDFVNGNIYQHLIHVTFPNDAVIEISTCCEASISADSNMTSGDLVPLTDARHFVEMVKYIYAMPEVLHKIFKAGDKVPLQVSFQITSEGALDVKISLALDREIQERHNISSCLKSFRV